MRSVVVAEGLSRVCGFLLGAVVVLTCTGLTAPLHAQTRWYTPEAYDVLRAEVVAADARLDVLSEGGHGWEQAVRAAIEARTAARRYLEGWLRSGTMDDDVAGFALETILDMYEWTIEHHAALGSCGAARQEHTSLREFLVPGHRPHSEIRARTEEHVERCRREQSGSQRPVRTPSAESRTSEPEERRRPDPAEPAERPRPSMPVAPSPSASATGRSSPSPTPGRSVWGSAVFDLAMIPGEYGDRGGPVAPGVALGLEHAVLQRATLLHQVRYLRGPRDDRGRYQSASTSVVGAGSALRVYSDGMNRTGFFAGTGLGLGGVYMTGENRQRWGADVRRVGWAQWGPFAEAQVGAQSRVVWFGMSLGLLNLVEPSDSFAVRVSAGFRI